MLGEAELVHDEISSMLASRGIPSPPWSVARKVSTARSFRDQVNSVQAYIERYWNPKDEIARRGCWRALLRLLVNRLQECDLAISYRTLCGDVGKIPQEVDRQFPGYIQAGYVQLILRPPLMYQEE